MEFFLNLLSIYHDACLFFTVHHDFQGMVESHVPHVLRLLDGRHLVEQLFLEDAIAGIGVDGEIAHTKRGEVLEEVGAL